MITQQQSRDLRLLEELRAHPRFGTVVATLSSVGRVVERDDDKDAYHSALVLLLHSPSRRPLRVVK